MGQYGPKQESVDQLLTTVLQLYGSGTAGVPLSTALDSWKNIRANGIKIWKMCLNIFKYNIICS